MTTTTTATTTSIATAKLDGIAHELEELGEEIKPHILHEKHGFNEFKESLVHKLRHAIYEKDKMFHQALNELEDREAHQTSLEALFVTLTDIQEELQVPRVYEMAWKSAELDLKHEQELLKKQQRDEHYTRELLHSLHRIERQLLQTRRQEPTKSPFEDDKLKHEMEQDTSVTSLLWRAFKLSARRIKNTVGFILPLGHKKKTKSV